MRFQRQGHPAFFCDVLRAVDSVPTAVSLWDGVKQQHFPLMVPFRAEAKIAAMKSTHNTFTEKSGRLQLPSERPAALSRDQQFSNNECVVVTKSAESSWETQVATEALAKVSLL